MTDGVGGENLNHSKYDFLEVNWGVLELFYLAFLFIDILKLVQMFLF